MSSSASVLQPEDDIAAAFAAHFDEHIGLVEGWLSRDEAHLLYRAARTASGGAIVEIGAYRGRSTVALALGSRDGAGEPVYSVDPHADWVGPGGGVYGPADREAFYRTVLRAGIAPWSRLVGLRSSEAARAIDGPLALLFIDGDHGAVAVMQDVRAWAPKLADGGLLLMDDVSNSFEGPRQAVERLLQEGWTQAGEPVGKIVALRPPRVPWRRGELAPSTTGGIRRQAAQELVTAARLDLGAKHLHARLAAQAPEARWGRRLYLAHLRIWNGFFEHVPRKRNPEDFLGAFERVLADTANSPEEGLDTVIPVTLDGSPLNGAHRIAAALLHNRPVRTVPVEVVPENACYDGAYFERLISARGDGGEPRLLLGMCLEFLRIAPACRLVMLFQHADRHRAEVDAEIARQGEIVWSYVRRYETPMHQRALVRLMYEGEPWVGTVDTAFGGTAGKAEACFAAGSVVRFVLVLPRSDAGPADWVGMKQRIRALCQVENHSVHATDTTAEAGRILRTTADPSAFALYMATRPRTMAGFDEQFEAFRALLVSQGRLDDVVVTGSAVMALFGLRDSADLDYVHIGPSLAADGRADIGSHNAYASLLPASVPDLLEDPGLHVMVDGVRFVRPAVLKAFKLRRGEGKDVVDVGLLEQFAATQPRRAEEAAGPRATLWLADGGGGQARQLARILALHAHVLEGRDVRIAPSPARDAIGPFEEWARELPSDPALRVLVVEGGPGGEDVVGRLASRMPADRLLRLDWSADEGQRDAQLSALAAHADLPDDPAWAALAKQHWDSSAEAAA